MGDRRTVCAGDVRLEEKRGGRGRRERGERKGREKTRMGEEGKREDKNGRGRERKRGRGMGRTRQGGGGTLVVNCADAGRREKVRRRRRGRRVVRGIMLIDAFEGFGVGGRAGGIWWV